MTGWSIPSEHFSVKSTQWNVLTSPCGGLSTGVRKSSDMTCSNSPRWGSELRTSSRVPNNRYLSTQTNRQTHCLAHRVELALQFTWFTTTLRIYDVVILLVSFSQLWSERGDRWSDDVFNTSRSTWGKFENRNQKTQKTGGWNIWSIWG